MSRTAPNFSPDARMSALLGGLARFRAAGTSGMLPHGETLFSYCALTRERLQAVVLAHPIVGVLLCGSKEIWRGPHAQTLRAGAVFVLPAGTAMDVLNLPDPRHGFYQSLILEIPDALDLLPGGVLPLPDAQPEAHVAPGLRPLQVRLTDPLVEAVLHAASAIADGPAQPSVRRARMTELLALLQTEPAARPLFDASISARVRALVGSDLSEDWKAPQVARQLGLSESTLRRRLAAEETSFAKLLRRERMLAARQLLDRRESAQSAALAVGYASRAHFARRFRAEFGSNPGTTPRSVP